MLIATRVPALIAVSYSIVSVPIKNPILSATKHTSIRIAVIAVIVRK
jgi:hypothetical protein